ncbi:uncharacterized protein L201_003889 [Kwoniella dendrophila CBS 6074]|uniref:Exonuclease domain-containing protein n=1 Tax=Kwoniella dendrophila CBS 6074 TaxID=1295534 RepID=A0AAX4JVW1_9TREE
MSTIDSPINYKLPELTQYLAIDYEFVGGIRKSSLAKVGIVDYSGLTIFESLVYVNPENITDYRTSTSGIKPGDLNHAPSYEEVTSKVKDLLRDKIVVGHTLFNDLAALNYRHPYELFRDTALYYPLRKLMGIKREGEFPSLKKLSKEILNLDIQTETENSGKGCGHDPIEDARATMLIFMRFREQYEIDLLNNKDCISGVPACVLALIICPKSIIKL